MSLTNEDIARIKVVSGPGSALYGPNSANGVVHVITHSPFESESTTLSVGGGRDIFTASLRHARRFGENVGFKVSAQYLRGQDRQSFDASEPDTVVKFRPSPTGPEPLGGPVSNQRDFGVGWRVPLSPFTTNFRMQKVSRSRKKDQFPHDAAITSDRHPASS